MKYRVGIVDDRPQVINYVSEELIFSGEVDMVLTAINGEDFLEKLKIMPPRARPQVVLMDIDMPVMNGITAVKIAKTLYEEIRFIMLSVFDNDDKLFEAIKAGADGYLLKEERFDEILNAIHEVVELGGAPMSPSIARKALNMLSSSPKEAVTTPQPVATNLSDRELEILKSLVNGLDYRQIATDLFISPNTVRNHIAKIYNKLYVTSKSQAIKLAIENKWV